MGFYDCGPSIEEQVKTIVHTVLHKLGIGERTVLTQHQACTVCDGALEDNPDIYGRPNGYRSHQPGDCLKALSERVMRLEKKVEKL